MRKVLTIVALWLSSISSFAGVVNRSDAEKVARAFLGSSKVEYTWNGMDDGAKYGTVRPAFYLFNGDGRWAIISADDIAVPVLMHGDGYLDEDNMPENMRMYLEGMVGNILQASAQGFEQSDDVKEMWANATMPVKASSAMTSKLLETAKWGQGDPYNILCPTAEGERCLTGCVATAMAIVLQYHGSHGYSIKGKGVIPAYKSRSGLSISDIDIDGYVYDWDSMPLTNGADSGNSWSDAQKAEVAALMAHCGAMVKMNYGVNGSGAYSKDVAPALIEHMSYSKYARELFRSSYSDREWLDRLKAEIDNGNPVIYGGVDKAHDEGHQFVCDGYNSNGEVRFNWGWNGAGNNTWCAVNYMGVQYTSGDRSIFNYNDSAIFGLYPDPEGTSSPSFWELYYMNEGLSLKSGKIGTDETFEIQASIGNYSTIDYPGTIGLLLLDKSGAVKSVLDSGELTIEAMKGGTITFECSYSGTFNVGDHVKAGYLDPSNNWQTFDISPSYPTAVTSIGAYDITLIDVPSGLSDGQRYYMELIYGQKPVSSVTWYYDGVERTISSVKVTSGQHTIKAEVTYKDGSTETLVKKISVN